MEVKKWAFSEQDMAYCEPKRSKSKAEGKIITTTVAALEMEVIMTDQEQSGGHGPQTQRPGINEALRHHSEENTSSCHP